MRIEKLRQLFRALYAFTFYLLFMEMFLLSTKRPHVSWIGLLVMAALFLGSYFLRNRVERFWPLILYTVLAGVGIWFLPSNGATQESIPFGLFSTSGVDEMERLMLIGLAVGLFFTACRHVSKGGILSEPMDVPWPIFVIGLLATVFGFLYDVEGLTQIAAILTGVALIFYLLILYTDSTQKYMESTKDVRGLPVRQIAKVNSIVIIGIFLCMVVAVLLGELVHLPDAFVGFLKAGLSILKTMFFGVSLAFQWVGNLFGAGNKESTRLTAQRLKDEVTEPATYSNILEFILKGAMIVLAVYVIVKITARILRMLSARFYQHSATERVEETVRKDVRTKIPHPTVFQRLRESMSMEERARRIYRKRVLELRREYMPAETETTADIEAKIRDEAGVSLPELTELYNRVRYGDAVIDRAYLTRMKNADRA